MFKFVLYAQVIRGTFPFRPSPHKGKELLYGANLCTHDFLSPGCDFSRFWLKGQFNLNLKRWLTDKSPGRTAAAASLSLPTIHPAGSVGRGGQRNRTRQSISKLWLPGGVARRIGSFKEPIIPSPLYNSTTAKTEYAYDY